MPDINTVADFEVWLDKVDDITTLSDLVSALRDEMSKEDDMLSVFLLQQVIDKVLAKIMHKQMAVLTE